jgi:DNA mismatch repair protein MutS
LLAELEGRVGSPSAPAAPASPAIVASPDRELSGRMQLSFFDLMPHPVVEYLRRLRIEELTPLEALNRLAELQRLASQQ